MKKLFLLLLVLPLAFFACSDDNNDTTPKDLNDMTIEEYMSEDQTFIWHGDWNDSEDPNYKPEYATKKYNPLAETYWRVSSTTIRHYTNDYKLVIYHYDEDAKTLAKFNVRSLAKMNDTAYLLADGSIGKGAYYVYSLSKNKDVLYYNEITVLIGGKISKDNWDILSKFDTTGITIIN